MKRRSAPPSPIPLLIAAGLVLAIGASGASAQDDAPLTLHVYTNLVQVPTLVLSEDRKPLPPIRREQFSVSLDRGPLFHPTQMRIEGDDPISLAVLLDVSGDRDDIVRSFAKAFPTLAPQYLHPKDHVTLYAVDCGLIRSADDIPADAGALTAGVASALVSPGLHGAKQRGACAGSVRLWDAVRQSIKALGDLPGRRVLLVVSNGEDGNSTSGVADVGAYAVSKSVAIFGIRDWVAFLHNQQFAAQMYRNGPQSPGTRVTGTALPIKAEDLFDQLCQTNGGFVANLSQGEVAKSLQNFVTMLRGRYILEFPRPDQGTPGKHSIDISVPGTSDFIRATGVSYMPPDPTVLADPNTIHTTPSPATFGDRRPLDPQQ